MMNLRARLNLITFCAIAATSWCGYSAYVSGHQFEVIQAEFDKSLELRALAVSLEEAPYDVLTFKRLQLQRSKITDKERQDEFSNVIQAYTARDTKTLRARIDTFVKFEVDSREESSLEMKKIRDTFVPLRASHRRHSARRAFHGLTHRQLASLYGYRPSFSADDGLLGRSLLISILAARCERTWRSATHV